MYKTTQQKIERNNLKKHLLMKRSSNRDGIRKCNMPMKIFGDIRDCDISISV